ncbi:NAD-dependent protein lipoamidase sirtuin-4, mitochondrial-like [Littorina saxatilis]|uniref:NAD-dependent protein deacylase n=1 Tax=Littorina saxatilis TaxID=31220 RepID=A0AAN9AJ57_9CAEN
MAGRIRQCVLSLRNSDRKKFVCYSWKRLCASTSAQSLPFVPQSGDATEEDVAQVEDFVSKSKRLFVLTGAGISTESGIPDYRSEGVGLYTTSKNRPVQYGDFLNFAEIRQRYWARNYVGWPRFSSFQPNEAHRVLSRWELAGKMHWLVTQNVDTLHYKARSTRVTELHGSAHRVLCLSCHHKILRNTMQEHIKALNPDWHAQSLEMAPDGDVQLTTEQVEGFKVPECQKCGGVLKPEIVFFGDNVPKHTVEYVFGRLAESDAVLIIGSSLEVYSGYRFANKAKEQGKPIAILNIGKTRADKIAQLKICARAGHVLPKVQIRS